MERILSLVLDEQGFNSLTLMKAEANEIDNFTTKKFENSEQIREHFKKKIEQFLEKSKSYVNSVAKKRGKMFRGRIIILEAKEKNSDLEFIEKRVLYKKHLVAFKEIVKDKDTMLRFTKLEHIGYCEYSLRQLISPFLYQS